MIRDEVLDLLHDYRIVEALVSFGLRVDQVLSLRRQILESMHGRVTSSLLFLLLVLHVLYFDRVERIEDDLLDAEYERGQHEEALLGNVAVHLLDAVLDQSEFIFSTRDLDPNLVVGVIHTDLLLLEQLVDSIKELRFIQEVCAQLANEAIEITRDVEAWILVVDP